MHASWQIPSPHSSPPHRQGPQMTDCHPLPRQQTSVQTDKEQATRVSLLSIASHSSHRRFGSPRLPSCPPAHLHPVTRPVPEELEERKFHVNVQTQVARAVES